MTKLDLLDLPSYFDVLNRFEGALSTLLNADWAGAIGAAAGWACWPSYGTASRVAVRPLSMWPAIQVGVA